MSTPSGSLADLLCHRYPAAPPRCSVGAKIHQLAGKWLLTPRTEPILPVEVFPAFFCQGTTYFSSLPTGSSRQRWSKHLHSCPAMRMCTTALVLADRLQLPVDLVRAGVLFAVPKPPVFARGVGRCARPADRAAAVTGDSRHAALRPVYVAPDPQARLAPALGAERHHTQARVLGARAVSYTHLTLPTKA